jgi:hypothetical protein
VTQCCACRAAHHTADDVVHVAHACLQVKEAREAAREAAALIQQLHNFVAEQGPDGDWRTWASSNLPYSGARQQQCSRRLVHAALAARAVANPAMQRNSNRLRCAVCCALLPVVLAGWQSPAPSPPRSPLAGRSAGSFRQLQGLQSPIAKRFMRAATGDDVIVVPGDKSALQLDGEADGEAEEEGDAEEGGAEVEAVEPAAAEGTAQGEEAQVDAASGAEVLVIQAEASGAELAVEGSAMGEQSVLDMAVEPSGTSTASSTGREDAAAAKQPPKQMQPRKLWGAHGSAPGSRPGSSQGSRPGSASTTGPPSSRRTTGSSVLEAGGPLRKQSSSSAVAEPVPSYAAGTRSSSARGAAGSKAAAGAGRQPGCPPSGAGRVKATPSRPQTAGRACCGCRDGLVFVSSTASSRMQHQATLCGADRQRRKKNPLTANPCLWLPVPQVLGRGLRSRSGRPCSTSWLSSSSW